MPHKIEVSDYKDGRGPQIGSVTHPNLSDVGKVTGHNIGTGYHSKMEDIALSIRQGGGSPKYMGTSYRSKTSDATDRHIEKWISKNSKS